MKNEPICYTNPVPYYRERPDEYSGFKRFSYSWLHIPTDTKGVCDIWCYNEKDFIKLLEYWNRSEKWKYQKLEF